MWAFTALCADDVMCTYAAGQMVEVFRTEPQMMRLATDPFVPALIRKKVIESVLKDSGATDVTKKLFGTFLWLLSCRCYYWPLYTSTAAHMCVCVCVCVHPIPCHPFPYIVQRPWQMRTALQPP